MDLSAFTEYEREFLSLTSPLPARISAILQYTSDAEQATSEIKRVDSDLITAKQRVRAARADCAWLPCARSGDVVHRQPSPARRSLWSPLVRRHS